MFESTIENSIYHVSFVIDNFPEILLNIITIMFICSEFVYFLLERIHSRTMVFIALVVLHNYTVTLLSVVGFIGCDYREISIISFHTAAFIMCLTIGRYGIGDGRIWPGLFDSRPRLYEHMVWDESDNSSNDDMDYNEQ